MAKYRTLCQQSCELRCPGCDDSSYTHLPKYNPKVTIHVPCAAIDRVADLEALCARFGAHECTPAELHEFIEAAFGETHAEQVVRGVLAHLYDDERRAALLLHSLHKRPNMRTACCQERVCFNCKAAGHHRDGRQAACRHLAFDEALCVTECAGCHVTLVKVDGCNDVQCPCGHRFSWTAVAQPRKDQEEEEDHGGSDSDE